MAAIELSAHAREMLRERGISNEWLERAISAPESQERDEEGNIHLIKTIPEHGMRVLHVIVNPRSEPPKVVTLFFDRRLRRLL